MSGAPLTVSLSVSGGVFSCQPHPYTYSRRTDKKCLAKSSLRKPLDRSENRGQKVFLHFWLWFLIAVRANVVCHCGQGMSPHPTMQFFWVRGVTNDCVLPFCVPDVHTDAGALTSNTEAVALKNEPNSFTTRP